MAAATLVLSADGLPEDWWWVAAAALAVVIIHAYLLWCASSAPRLAESLAELGSSAVLADDPGRWLRQRCGKALHKRSLSLSALGRSAGGLRRAARAAAFSRVGTAQSPEIASQSLRVAGVALGGSRAESSQLDGSRVGGMVRSSSHHAELGQLRRRAMAMKGLRA